MDVNKNIVLSLNKNWQPVGVRSIKESIISLMGGGDGDTPPALSLDMDFPLLENGEYDFNNPLYLNPVKWNEWITLPIREFDSIIHSCKMSIRVPTIIISTNYAKMPLKKFRASRQSIYDRDGGVCQFTGEYVGKKGNLDHLIPKERGGRETFENLVWSKKEINTLKANRTPKEAGLKLIRQPKEPMPVPVSLTIKECHPTWRPFLISK